MFHKNQISLKNIFLITVAYISFYSLQNSLFNDIFWFKKENFTFPYYTNTFLVGAHRFRVPFPELQIFSETFWALLLTAVYTKKTILWIFAYLFIYEVTTTNVNFRFYKQSSQAATGLICERASFAENASISV